MASGYTSAVTNGSFSIRFYWSSSYNASTNQSTITVIPQVYNTGNYGGDLRACGYNLSGAGIYLNGTRIYAFDATWGTANNLVCAANVNTWTNFPPYSGSIGTVTVAHDANGVATATVRFLGTVVPLNYESYRKGIDTGNQTITITENAASTVASCSSNVETQGTFSLTMTRKASTNYHVATFKYNNVTTLYTSGRFDTSLSFSVPRSWFTNYPALTSLPITVSIQTYNSGGTAVGSAVTRSLTVTADAGMKPSVSSGWATSAPYNTGAVSGKTGYIKGYSKAQITFNSSKIDMSSAPGASISSYKVVCQGETASASPYRTPVLGSTSVNILCTVTDTRGRTASETLTITVMDYANPVITGQQVFRCNSSSQPDEDGTYLSVKATMSVSSLNSQNTGTLKAAYKTAGGSYGAETTLTSGTATRLGPISADSSYTVRITATDSLGNVTTYYGTVPTRKWAMKFRPDGNGVAFGKAAEYNKTFEIASDWSVRLGTPLPFEQGGVGGTSVSTARANLQFPRYQYYYYGSDTAGTNGWYKMCTIPTNNNNDYNITLLITSSYRRIGVGVLHVHVRRNNTTGLILQAFYWLSRYGLGVGDVYYKDNGDGTFSLYVNQTSQQWGRVQVQILTQTGTQYGWDAAYYFVNNAAKESAAPTGGSAAADGVILLTKTACGLTSADSTASARATLHLSQAIANFRMVQITAYSTVNGAEKQCSQIVFPSFNDVGRISMGWYSDTNTSYYMCTDVVLGAQDLYIYRAWFSQYSSPSFKVVGIY